MAFVVEQRSYPSTRTTVVRPVGELSVSSIPVLRKALRQAVRDDPAVIVVDLGLTSVPDEAVVGRLVEAARLGREFGAEVVVATAPEEVAATLASRGLFDRRRPRKPTLVRDAEDDPAQRRSTLRRSAAG